MTLNRRTRKVLVNALDAGTVCVSVIGAFLLRFDFAIPRYHARLLLPVILLALAPKLITFWFYGVDRSTWRFFTVPDLRNVILANVAGSAIFATWCIFCYGLAVPRSIYSLDFLICTALCTGFRISVRMYRESLIREVGAPVQKRLLIYGASDAALTLLREIQGDPKLNCRVVGLIDDDSQKKGSELMGIRVLGRGRDVAMIADTFRRKNERIDEIVIAMPSATGRQMHEALANCHAADVPCKTIPTLRDVLANKVLTSQIRNIKVEDLLGREAVRLDESLIRSRLERRVVMITGGGGSIGSELCRQIASYHPERLVIFERAESDLFRIHMELSRRFPSVDIEAVIGDIREPARISQVILQHGVSSIFHAAAYKHVPVMEQHVVEAVKNNVFGTWNVAEAARAHRVEQFLMISSDKAVNPTSVMGVTKRIAELIVSAMPEPGEGGHTRFVSVRFGNVLGSNGSVVPLFQEQINAGGPVTVTHPKMRRYFMTIPEAVQLVLQASTMGHGSEVFVLDMGEPLNIMDIARNMIRLSGKEPEKDIEIRITGLRPGEKLFEELALSGEDVLPTYHEKIRIFKGPRKNREEIERWLAKLQEITSEDDVQGILSEFQHLVPEYLPGERKAAAQSQEPALAAAG
jgi:FlaA1/EpsC-like NDP-sugar epimerase